MSLALVPVYPDFDRDNKWDRHLNADQRHDLFKFIIANYEKFDLETGTKTCGVISVGGWAELFDLRDTFATSNANKVDVLAIWFFPNTTFPSANRSTTHRGFTITEAMRADELWKMPMLVRNFITGIEQQLMRRVITIGSEMPDLSEKSGLMQIGGEAPVEAKKLHLMLTSKFLVVPRRPEARHRAPPIPDSDLEEVIVWLWRTFREQGVPIPDLIGDPGTITYVASCESQAKQIQGVIVDLGAFSATHSQIMEAANRIRRAGKTEPNEANLSRIVADWKNLSKSVTLTTET